jgi:hypothetical protein
LIPLQNNKSAQLLVERHFDNPDEEHVLMVAESVDYLAITSFERFDGSSDPEAYINQGTYLPYTYANFIDTEIINYYQTRYDYQQTQTDPSRITLTYIANVTQLDHLRVFNSPAEP